MKPHCTPRFPPATASRMLEATLSATEAAIAKALTFTRPGRAAIAKEALRSFRGLTSTIRATISLLLRCRLSVVSSARWGEAVGDSTAVIC